MMMKLYQLLLFFIFSLNKSFNLFFQITLGTLLMISTSEAVINAARHPNISSNVVDEPPEGYYAFIESPNAEPPKVRRPPYVQSDMECPGEFLNFYSTLYYYIRYFEIGKCLRRLIKTN